ncbi:efflux transporter outer membrane subunit OpmH [Cocleimonas flava]|uniref:Outer membrane protein n=1 Tax=Cocleimonas flava TaxID=634765 RepID=A0A4R1F7R2_9GAMM|nr:TolC family outer membrane protein [Cocleimonas flava]TCJ88679.1 outer membrane protein [Cocleimonas flava]
MNFQIAKKSLNIKLFQGALLKRPFLLSAIIMATVSAPVNAETLLQVYEDAKKNDAQLKVSEMGFLAALEAKPQVLSGLKPQLTVTAGANYTAQYTGKRSYGGEDAGGYANIGYDLNLTKVIINKQLDAQIDQVDASILQSKALLESDRQDLIIRVADAYFAYLNANDTLVFRKAEKNAIGKQLNQVKAFFDAGRSAITDVKEAQASYDLSVAQIEIANQQIDVARESLRAITTRAYKHLNGAADNVPLLVPKPTNIEAWSKAAVENSKDLIAAKHAVEVAQKTIEYERAAKKGTLNLVANQGVNSVAGEDIYDSDKFDATVGVQYSLNLLDGGNISSRVREARHKLHQAQQTVELQKRLATQQSRAAYLTIVSGLAQVKALKQALNSSQTAASATQAGFEAGTRTAVDVLLALRNTFSARRDYTSARYDFLLNTLKLKQASGTLTEADLAALSKILLKKT